MSPHPLAHAAFPPKQKKIEKKDHLLNFSCLQHCICHVHSVKICLQNKPFLGANILSQWSHKSNTPVSNVRHLYRRFWSEKSQRSQKEQRLLPPPLVIFQDQLIIPYSCRHHISLIQEVIKLRWKWVTTSFHAGGYHGARHYFTSCWGKRRGSPTTAVNSMNYNVSLLGKTCTVV